MEGEGLNYVYVNGIIDTGCKEKWGELFVSPEEAIGESGGDHADFLNYATNYLEYSYCFGDKEEFMDAFAPGYFYLNKNGYASLPSSLSKVMSGGKEYAFSASLFAIYQYEDAKVDAYGARLAPNDLNEIFGMELDAAEWNDYWKGRASPSHFKTYSARRPHTRLIR